MLSQLSLNCLSCPDAIFSQDTLRTIKFYNLLPLLLSDAIKRYGGGATRSTCGSTKNVLWLDRKMLKIDIRIKYSKDQFTTNSRNSRHSPFSALGISGKHQGTAVQEFGKIFPHTVQEHL
jgi:hypothetical protein